MKKKENHTIGAKMGYLVGETAKVTLIAVAVILCAAWLCNLLEFLCSHINLGIGFMAVCAAMMACVIINVKSRSAWEAYEDGQQHPYHRG